MESCYICSALTTDVMRVRDGDEVAARIRAFASHHGRNLPPTGDIYLCQQCLSWTTGGPARFFPVRRRR